MSKNRTEDPADLAELFKALSNPHRLAIYLRLLDCCPAPTPGCCDVEEYGTCVGDLGRDLDIAPSTVSHHIKELRRSGLIHVERDGRFVQCWAAPEAAERIRRLFQHTHHPSCSSSQGC